MPRGPLSKEAKKERALAQIAEVLGKTVEEVKKLTSVEKQEDKLREAQSVVNYFESKGEGFKKAICESCNRSFAYAYHIDAIKCCSIRCMRIKLQKLGLDWRPDQPDEYRWGKYVPAIVPPSALGILESLLGDTPGDQLDNNIHA